MQHILTAKNTPFYVAQLKLMNESFKSAVDFSDENWWHKRKKKKKKKKRKKKKEEDNNKKNKKKKAKKN